METEKNYLDLVRDYFPNVSDKEADWILWYKTPFPMRMDEQEIGRYLAEYKKESPEANHLNDHVKKEIELINEHALSFSNREDVVDNNPELLEFAHAVYNATQDILKMMEVTDNV